MAQPHEVEPIPWKTGRAGRVPALDVATPPPVPPRPVVAAASLASTSPLATAPSGVASAAPLGVASAVTAAGAPARRWPRWLTAKKLPGSGIPPRRVAVVLKWA
ncbi:MAG: hypothetical protein FWD17_18800, partial [Polyangiaceae bacterium]|nr:hypothetical protein [Polyangiaceae bacterium]